MRRLGLIALVLLLAGATPPSCDYPPATVARNHLGAGAVCVHQHGEVSGPATVRCVRSGAVFECLVDRDGAVACGLVTSPDAER